MGNLYAGQVNTKSDAVLTRGTVPDANTTIEGGERVIWVCTTPTAERTITVKNYDRTRFDHYMNEGPRKPHIMIKCGVDCSGFEILVKDEAGNTLYTFTEDHSTTAIYIVLRLSTSNTWELA